MTLSRILLTSCVAALFTTPFLLLYFNRLSLLTPIANVLILPMLPLLFVICILFLLFYKVMFLGNILSQIVVFLFNWILFVIEKICEIPFSSMDIYNPYEVAFVIFIILMTGIFLLFSKKENYKKDLCLMSVCLVISLSTILILPRMNRVYEGAKVTVVDVGNGGATIIETADKIALIDCGTSDSSIKPYARVLKQLSLSGKRSIDYLILTHYHSDHVNGVADVLDRISVKNVILRPFTEEDKMNYDIIKEICDSKANIIEISEKMEITLSSDSMITLFPPLSGLNSTDENENGIAIELKSQGRYGLFTGDFNKKHEITLMRDYDIASDLLLVSHHGSKYSSWEGVIDYLNPDVSVISCGADNEYGHPNEETLDTLKNAGSMLLRSDQDGTVIFYFQNYGLFFKK